MNKQSFQLLDTESGNTYTLETSSGILSESFTVILPEANGSLALVKDVENLSDKIKNGDIDAGNSKKLEGKTASDFADKNLSNVILPQVIIDTLKGYTGSKGDTGYVGSKGENGTVGLQGLTGYTGSAGTGFKITAIFNSLSELLSGTTTNDTFALVAGTLSPDADDYGKLYHRFDNTWTYITDMSIKGASGIQGPIGFTGSQGVQGITGFTGSTGYVGSKGDTGYVGSAGTNGTVSTAAPSGGVNGDTWFQY